MKFELHLDYKELVKQYNYILNLEPKHEVTPIVNIMFLLKKQMEDNLPKNAQEIIEAYLPNYSNRQDVLEVDILTRYFDKEETSNEDAEWLVSIGSDFDRKKYLKETYTALYYEALQYKN